MATKKIANKASAAIEGSAAKKTNRSVKTENSAPMISQEKMEKAKALMEQMNYADVKKSVYGLECKPSKVMCEAIIANAFKTDGGAMYAYIPIELLDVDESYQRNKGHWKKIGANWDDNMCDPLLVSYRDGRFYLVDGLNRTRGAIMAGKERLYCLIRVDMTRADEANIFANQGTNKQAIRGPVKLNAEIISGKDSVATAVGRVCNKHGVIYKPAPHGQGGVLTSPVSAKRIVAEYGEEMLDDVFALIKDLGWHMESTAYSRVPMNAAANVLKTCSDRKKAMAKIVKMSCGASIREHLLRAMNANPGISNRSTCLSKLWGSYVHG